MEEIINEKPIPMVVTKVNDSSMFVTVNLDITKTDEGWTCVSITRYLDHYPQQEDLMKIVNDYINAKTDERILTGLRWRDLPVYLSTENQINIKAAYDLAFQTGGAMLPIRFKLGEDEKGMPVYFDFEDMATFGDFYTNCVAWIQKCINDGWEEKDGFDYDELLNQ